MDGVWVVGGVERTPERRCFLATVPNRTAETLTNLLTAYIAPGSIIHTDCWKGYNQLENQEEDYIHRTVNYSVEFLSSDGVHTNTIEGNIKYSKYL